MSVKVLQDRLRTYDARNQLEEENALKEIAQDIALSGLSRAGFFKVAAFQGGTCLRILYGLSRFSEDLDFSLQESVPHFEWAPYIKSLQMELEAYGYKFAIQDRSDAKQNVKTVFLKDDSIGKILVLNHRGPSTSKSIKIKLEIDTNPPKCARFEQKYVDFPVTVPVLSHDLPTLFAGKSHALLCRRWEKGRDWFDFLWYVGRKVPINFDFLGKAIDQLGPWKDQGLRVDQKWFLENLRKRVWSTEWSRQKKDVARFLKTRDLDLLNHWSAEFFLERIDVLSSFL